MHKALPLAALVTALACDWAFGGDGPQPPKADAHLQKVLAAHKSLDPKRTATLPAEQARAQPAPAGAIRKV